MKKAFPVHPIFFTIAPLLWRYYANLHTIPFQAVLLPAAMCLFLTVFFWYFLAKITKESVKSAVITSVFVNFFFLYGDIERLGARYLPRFVFQSWENAVSLFFAPCLILALISAAAILKTRGKPAFLTGYLNIISILLLFFSVPQIIAHKALRLPQWSCFRSSGREENLSFPAGTPRKSLPDIYYIILDGYGRADVLKDLFAYDNSEVIDYLRGRGFFIAERSRSNYVQTLLSVSSSMNMEYVQNIASPCFKPPLDREHLGWLIRAGRVKKLLRSKGYSFIGLPTANIYMGMDLYDLSDKKMRGSHYFISRYILNEYTDYVLDASAARQFLRFLPLPIDLYRRAIVHNFEQLKRIPSFGEPTFTFCYIGVPHPPFVFDESGGQGMQRTRFKGEGTFFRGTQEDYINGYRRQLAFVNRKIKEVIDAILSESHTRPVIIIQADHGPGSGLDWEDPRATNMEERLGILNAYYIPCHKSGQLLYPSISPVNSFRAVFNACFDADYELLEDRHYYSAWMKPFNLLEVE